MGSPTAREFVCEIQPVCPHHLFPAILYLFEGLFGREQVNWAFTLAVKFIYSEAEYANKIF